MENKERYFDDFFKNLEGGEIFTYHPEYMVHEVRKIARKRGVELIYIDPLKYRSLYEIHGCFACIVSTTNDKEVDIQPDKVYKFETAELVVP
jgi:hypothetical protein